MQIYFDFSGYTDLALGMGILLGVQLPPNFNNPYLARTPAQFWQRWHISLSLWFRAYLFSPLSRSLIKRWGSRRLTLAQNVANLATMALVGLWHGASWGFILWGIYHGLLLNLYAWANRRRTLSRFLAAPGVLFIAVLIGWAFFLSPNLSFTQHLFEHLLGLHGVGSISAVLDGFGTAAVLVGLIALAAVLTGLTEAANLPRIRHPLYAALIGGLAVLAILHLDQVIDFLYVQF
jgi:alginate O-acetyltransferase complex protein AlgI